MDDRMWELAAEIYSLDPESARAWLIRQIMAGGQVAAREYPQLLDSERGRVIVIEFPREESHETSK